MAEAALKKIESLKARRLVCTKQLDRINEFLSEINTLLSEFEVRLQALDSVFKAFEQLQIKLEDIDPKEIGAKVDVRAECEEMYYKSRSKILHEIQSRKSTLRTENVVSTETKSSNQLKLPKVNIPIFSGEVTQWLSFHEIFNSLIHNNSSLSNVSKLHYLISSLSGQAARTIQSLEITDDNYEVALNLLIENYDNKRVIATEHIKKVMMYPAIQKPSSSSLRQFCDEINSHLRALTTLGRPVSQWDDLLVQILLPKLDSATLNKWNEEGPTERMPSYQELIKFLTKRTLILNDDIPQPNHNIYKCDQFLNLPVAQKQSFVSGNQLCFNCIKPNHDANNCQASKCRKCNNSHHTLLHDDNVIRIPQDVPQSSSYNIASTSNDQRPTSNNVASSSNSLTSPMIQPYPQTYHLHKNTSPAAYDTQSRSAQAILATAVVFALDKQNTPVPCRVLLDSASHVSLLTERFANLLGIRRKSKIMSICSIGENSLICKHQISFTIKSRFNHYAENIDAYIVARISEFLPDAPINTNGLSIPSNINLADPLFGTPSRVDLLIGAEYFFGLLSIGQIKLGPWLPTLQNTVFGWVVSGSIAQGECKKKVHCLVNDSDENSENENIASMLTSFWEIEKHEQIELPFTKNEQICEEHFLKNVKRLRNGRIEVRLPFKQNPESLGNSYATALRRFYALERKLIKNHDLAVQYVSFMKEYKQLKHMVEIKNQDFGKLHYYIPHHCITKPESSTTKLRVVFDASAKCDNGVSLNDILYVGPVVQPDLFSLLIKFRSHNYVFTADVTKMYRQIALNEQDRAFHQILWRDRPDEEIKTYELCTVTYGTASASFLATRALLYLAEEEGDKFPVGASTIKTEFYVDDILTGASTLEELECIKRELRGILDRGGLTLKKWCSNNNSLLQDIPHEEKEQFFQLKNNDVIKTLGVVWDPKADTFFYKVNAGENKHITKRTVLADIARLYDPLGLINPVTVLAKIFYKGFGSYVGEMLIKKVSVRLLCAKSKVAPVRNVCLPRLELCAAQLMVQLVKRIRHIFQDKFERVYYWTDSSIVIAWLSSESHHWQTFVANRVATIQNLSSIDQWRHVSTKQNPADIVSRGAFPGELMNSKLWFHGPEFLYLSEEHWPNSKSVDSVDENLLERRPTKHTFPLQEDTDFVINLKFNNNHQRTLKIVAYILRFFHNSLALYRKKERVGGPFTLEEMENALHCLIKMIQQSNYGSDILLLKQKRSISPFIDEKGILRVGGRINNADVGYKHKHPALLPNNHPFTKALIRDIHIKYHHVGEQGLLSIVREQYWPVHVKPLIRRVIRRCILCARARPRFEHPQMGNLPEYRVMPSRPFTTVGTDFCGPFMVHSRRRGTAAVKVYVAVFVCLVSKAVHLELVGDLTTSSFLGALRRFISRRGLCRTIYSDNATNYIGARNELRALYKMFQDQQSKSEIMKTCLDEGIEWKHIPPRSPHFGGIWEAAVKSAKHHMKRILHLAALTYEELNTLIIQIECILNSRPLSPLSEDPNDLKPLTPGHFLTGSSLIAIPEPDLCDKNLSYLNRWQRVQWLMQQFWHRWKNEYLHTLQQRNKWKRNKFIGLQLNDIVIIRDDNIPPLKWKLGRVMELHPGTDHIVRVVTLKTATGIFKRAVANLCRLPVVEAPPDAEASSVVEAPLVLQDGENVQPILENNVVL
ncbi:uncharacterized protein LOC129954081 [Eupeodes corollae]|uniref:uncharacterized protein LOC129954081 n=1 Tax=Eupeodes corollae TaxID=290404 RepID=UPI0024920AB4|nr:uncharacterized protein LOC129954081 [Eupeodes corollae]